MTFESRAKLAKTILSAVATKHAHRSEGALLAAIKQLETAIREQHEAHDDVIEPYDLIFALLRKAARATTDSQQRAVVVERFLGIVFDHIDRERPRNWNEELDMLRQYLKSQIPNLT